MATKENKTKDTDYILNIVDNMSDSLKATSDSLKEMSKQVKVLTERIELVAKRGDTQSQAINEFHKIIKTIRGRMGI